MFFNLLKLFPLAEEVVCGFNSLSFLICLEDVALFVLLLVKVEVDFSRIVAIGCVAGEVLFSLALSCLVGVYVLVSDMLLDRDEVQFGTGEFGMSSFTNFAFKQLIFIRDMRALIPQ